MTRSPGANGRSGRSGTVARRGGSAGATLLLALSLLAIVASLIALERQRAGLDIAVRTAGGTPATVYRQPDGAGPLVVIAHGFAGSRQLMHASSLTLARAGYTVVAFDFEGHGRNPVPMSGDVTTIDGTTALLVAETRRVLAMARSLPGARGGVALLGHSMATDIVVRAAIEERDAGTPVDAVVAISMFSEAVTPELPERLLIVNGEWEGRLRAAARTALAQVDADAPEGSTVTSGDVSRRAVFAPHVEHVGVLYSAATLREIRKWLDDTFDRDRDGSIVRPGLWILLLLGGIVSLFRSLVERLPASPDVRPADPRPLAWAGAVLIPALLVPVAATRFEFGWLPVLVADYLVVHLALLGLLQLLLLKAWKRLPARIDLAAIVALTFWGIGVFGVALDRHAASFLPTAERLPIILWLCVGTVPFMLADSLLSGGGHGRWWQRVVPRVAFVASLGLAVWIDPARLGFLFIVLPVIVLFYLVHGLMGRWIARRHGPLAAGIGLGSCLAWATGVSFPLFDAG